MSETESSFVGTLVGTAVGDAIGELAFAAPSGAALDASVGAAPTLVYTDDTAMALALAEELADVVTLDPERLGERFRAHYQREPWRGYGPGPPRIFAAVARGAGGYVDIARSLYGGEGSLGNGAAMRVVSVGLCFHASGDLYEQARMSALPTHAHPVGVDGAAVLARAVAEVVPLSAGGLAPQALLDALDAFARTAEVADKLREVRRCLDADLPPEAAIARLGAGIAVHESMPFALYAFLRNPDDFRACLECAALNGGDRDTMAAMACAVSGAYLGVQAIPSEWRAKLENRDTIESLARHHHERCMAR